MNLFQKLMLACIYVLGSDTPININFSHSNHTYEIYNYVETSYCGLDIGVDFVVDNGLYTDLWWEIRHNKTTNYNRLREAVEYVVKMEQQNFQD